MMFSSVLCFCLLELVFESEFHYLLVRRLLCSARPVVIQTPVNPTASDQDLQQAQLWQLAQRTTALPFGRGAFTLATTCTLLTEALVVPKLVLAGRLPAQQNATVNLDPNVRNVQELKSWPEFHNAVSAGLRLAPPQVLSICMWLHRTVVIHCLI
ncbi:Anaphase-promoting complex subunit 1 [Datura stramonium]|uniref:Anaphase-promoting complex subunit 1 n=1 Tax=Datura stramonium TaxID=4076 RepID=A0ABS8RLH8_DATST|nr:Anaphase-promoting complex subunit 1 [Datura stramonium]